MAAAVTGAAVGSTGAATAAARPAPVNATSDGREPMTLYQYEVCPWCNKVKAALDYRRIPYRAVEVHPVWKGELSWSDYKKVPVLVLPDGEQVNESTAIVDMIYTQYGGSPAAPTRRGCASPVLLRVRSRKELAAVRSLPDRCHVPCNPSPSRRKCTHALCHFFVV